MIYDIHNNQDEATAKCLIINSIFLFINFVFFIFSMKLYEEMLNYSYEKVS